MERTVNNMSEIKQHTNNFLKGITTLTGLSYKKIQQYAKENNPFNILEHPQTIEPNDQQLMKIGLLNEFISTYNLLKIYEGKNQLNMNSSSISGKYFISLLSGMKDKERFLVAFLDNSNNIIETRTMSEGTIGEAIVFPRDILKAAIACDCRSMILAHNHPGISTTPSNADKALTQKMVDIFTPLDIKILDHIIVGGSSYCSMAEKGLVPHSSKNLANYEAMVMDKELKIEKNQNDCISDQESSIEDDLELEL